MMGLGAKWQLLHVALGAIWGSLGATCGWLSALWRGWVLYDGVWLIYLDVGCYVECLLHEGVWVLHDGVECYMVDATK